jgi:hypothetical protein
MRFKIFTLLLVFTLIGCAASKRPGADAPVTAIWKLENFRVQFQAGPTSSEGRSFSFYEITKTSPEELPSLVMESAHSLARFGSVTNGDPKYWIRIIEDSNAKALLIEEQIPNDCGPCLNYLWVRPDSNGYIRGTYLRLPSKVTGPPNAPIDYEYPKVRSLDGGVLRYDYSIGGTVTKRIDQIEKSDRPTPPG